MAPVQVGISVKDLEAAHEQYPQRQRIDPMGPPGDQIMAVLTGSHEDSLLASVSKLPVKIERDIDKGQNVNPVRQANNSVMKIIKLHRQHKLI